MKKISSPSAAPGGVPRLASTSDEPTSALEIVAPGKLSADHQMGQQLTEQYHRACGGMTEVLKFGGLMMGLRESLFTREHTSGVLSNNEADSVKGWLAKHAPEVNRTTAYRFLHVAEAVMEEWQPNQPAKISFVDLVTTPADQLSEKLRLKQSELWDFVNGTSQKSWLDRFAPTKFIDHSKRAPRRLLTPEEQLIQKDKFAQEKYQTLWAGINNSLDVDKDSLLRLPVSTANPMHEVSLVMLRDTTAAFLDLLNSAIKAH